MHNDLGILNFLVHVQLTKNAKAIYTKQEEQMVKRSTFAILAEISVVISLKESFGVTIFLRTAWHFLTELMHP